MITTVLQGYMIAKDGYSCINTGDSSAIASLDGSTFDPAGLQAAGCTLMSVKDGAADGKF